MLSLFSSTVIKNTEQTKIKSLFPYIKGPHKAADSSGGGRDDFNMLCAGVARLGIL